MSGIFVPGRGPLGAKLCVLGEAPGRQEEEQRRPFVGASGQLQESYMKRVGIDPGTVRYENVYPFRPYGKEGNINAVPREEFIQWQEDCLARLDTLSSVQIIIPVGNTALGTLTALSQVSLRRGSMYPWKNIYGRPVKVIPTLHPAAILRDTTLEYRTIKDWERIARELSRGADVIYPERRFLLDPPEEQFWQWWSDHHLTGERANPIALDIETNPREKKILCVGFAGSSALGISLSWTREHKEWIRIVCDADRPKLLQNGLYDLYWLRMFGIEVRNYQYDCLAMSHLLRANEKHSLAYMTSIWTDEPYYKGGEDPDAEKVWEGKDWYALLEYNARDCMVEYEVGWEKLWPQVQERGLAQKYWEYYQALFSPLLDLMTHGVNVDREMMRETYETTQASATQAMAEAQALVETQLFTFKTQGEAALYAQRVLGESSPEIEKAVARLRTPLEQVWQGILDRGISDKVLARILYQQWALPGQKHRKTGSITTDEHALRKVLQKVEKRGDQAKVAFLRAVLKHRHERKLSEFYNPARLDEDGRLRCEYSYNTRPGRLASKKNPMGTGTNLQNQSRKVRAMFLPDKDCLMCEVDLSQIQARFVYVMAYQVTGDMSLLRLATMHPSDGDIHTESAAQMFHVAPEQVTKEQRYKGKVTEHACVDAETEVLTPWGWRHIAEIAGDPVELLAVWDPETRYIWFEQPAHWTQTYYEGEMLLIDGEGINQCITPNHRMPHWSNNHILVKQAQDLPASARIPTAGGYVEQETTTTFNAIRLNVATQADGCVEYRKDWEYVRFRFKKQRKVERLLSLLQAEDIPYSCVVYKSGITCITVKGPRASWMTSLLNKGGRIWNEGVLTLSREGMEVLLDELKYWDGWQSANVSWYFSKYEENMRVIKTLAHLCNKRLTWNIQPGGTYAGSLSQRQYSRRYTKTKLQYQGEVYCPTVSTGFFLIRRHDEISVTGNSNFGLQAEHLQEVFLKGEEGIAVSIQECQELLQRKFQAKPGILEWQRAIREEALREKKLTNAWGMELDLTYERPGEDLWRKCYAWKPQSDEAKHLNMLGLIPTWRYIKERQYKSRINMQVHDALVFSLRPTEAYDILRFCINSLEQVREYYTVPLVIPCAVKIGLSWKGNIEWKILPTEEEFMQVAEEVMHGIMGHV